MPRKVFFLSFSAVALLGGCYGYYPASTSEPAGRDVQVTLTDSGAVVLARQIGGGAESVFGHVVTGSASALTLAVTSVRQRSGNDVDWKGEQVAIDGPLIAKVEERRFSRARTGLFSGIVTVALVAIRQGLSGKGQGAGSGLPGQGTAR